MVRNPYLIGNWKMHKTARESSEFIEALLPLVDGCQANILLAVSFTSISAAACAAKGTALWIGAQNMHEAREGAFTGEIAGLMLKEAGASFVLLGHSERRTLFGETDGGVRKKIFRALAVELLAVLCVGETLSERKSGKTEEILKQQVLGALDGLQKEDMRKILVAYEPVWAIGAEKAASPEIAQQAHALIRAELAHLFGQLTASTIPILYGGSVKSENASSMLDQTDIDGLLVGSASLEPASFAAIAKTLCEKKS